MRAKKRGRSKTPVAAAKRKHRKKGEKIEAMRPSTHAGLIKKKKQLKKEREDRRKARHDLPQETKGMSQKGTREDRSKKVSSKQKRKKTVKDQIPS